MLQDRLNIAGLIGKSIGGTITERERHKLDAWLAADVRNEAIYRSVVRDMGATLGQYERFSEMADFSGVRPGMVKAPARRTLLRRRIAAAIAAAILIPALIFTGIIIEKRPETDFGHRTATAWLVLPDGTRTELSDASDNLPSGVMKEHDGVTVLSYRADGIPASVAPEGTNKIVVPRGCDYRLVLSDSTVVHLNADSEIEFPVGFSGPKREVRLRGQAWFDVARDEMTPFVVVTSRSEVTVLGTEFDVSDYEGRPYQTTLVSGSVAVAVPGGESRTLTPGQQAEITAGGIGVRDVDTRLYTAWKDGYFVFEEATVAGIMQKLSEWYDTQYVIADPALDDVRITARLRKYATIAPVLDVLTMLDELDFEITDNKAIKVYRNDPGR